MVGGAAYATAWQGRCQGRGSRSTSASLNPAGDLMHWLGGELTEIESRATREAEGRQKLGRDDRAIRLELVAPGIIQNCNPAELDALARELSDHAAAEAEGR